MPSRRQSGTVSSCRGNSTQIGSFALSLSPWRNDCIHLRPDLKITTGNTWLNVAVIVSSCRHSVGRDCAERSRAQASGPQNESLRARYWKSESVNDRNFESERATTDGRTDGRSDDIIMDLVSAQVQPIHGLDEKAFKITCSQNLLGDIIGLK